MGRWRRKGTPSLAVDSSKMIQNPRMPIKKFRGPMLQKEYPSVSILSADPIGDAKKAAEDSQAEVAANQAAAEAPEENPTPQIADIPPAPKTPPALTTPPASNWKDKITGMSRDSGIHANNTPGEYNASTGQMNPFHIHDIPSGRKNRITPPQRSGGGEGGFIQSTPKQLAAAGGVIPSSISEQIAGLMAKHGIDKAARKQALADRVSERMPGNRGQELLAKLQPARPVPPPIDSARMQRQDVAQGAQGDNRATGGMNTIGGGVPFGRKPGIFRTGGNSAPPAQPAITQKPTDAAAASGITTWPEWKKDL